MAKNKVDWTGFACPKNPFYRSAACRAWFRDLPCHLCGAKAEHHHETLSGKGTALKGPDDEAVPLCPECHSLRHAPGMGRETFWETYGEDWREVVGEYKRRWWLESTANRIDHQHRGNANDER
ncbi:DUF968 domain-containing protein [Desulfoluna spongiiphila]